MIKDPSALIGPDSPQYDLCIIGSGAAGITLAREMINSKLKVCLLEAGGQERTEESQDFYNGEFASKFTHHPLNVSRLRFFGGTTNHWSGTCRPFAPRTFMRREGIPYTGWPISLSDLVPYQEKAHHICKLPGPFDYSNDFWGNFNLSDNSKLASVCFQKAYPVRFNENYGDELKNATNIDIFLNTTALELITSANGTVVESVKTVTTNKQSVLVKAKRFVLACGGIENARILLLSNKVHKNGLANSKDMVGRFFTNHPGIYAAEFVPTDEYINAHSFFFDVKEGHQELAKTSQLRPRLIINEQVQEQEQLNQIMFDFYPTYRKIPGVEAAKQVRDEILDGEMPDNFYDKMKTIISDIDEVIPAIFTDKERPAVETITVVIEMEQTPNPDSRVLLSDQLDNNGQRRVKLDWRISDDDKLRAKRSFEILGSQLAAEKVGRLKLNMKNTDEEWIGGFHQMGTTRMSASPSEGVVDKNCRAHDVENLYFAGSSVFPVVGIERPTLNIVAMTLRLADHLKNEFGVS